MDLKPTFERHYPEGVRGGQCAFFARRLADIPPLGNSLAEKMSWVRRIGLTAKQANGNFNPGDVVVTDDDHVHGHVFVVNNVMGDSLRVTESNFNLDERVHHVRMVARRSPRILGLIRRPLKVGIVNPPFVRETFSRQRVLVLTSHIDPEHLEGNLQGFRRYCSKVNRKTGGNFQIELTVKHTDAEFSTLHGTGLSGPGNVEIPVVYVDPAGIAHVARLAELELNTQFDVICLLYDPLYVRGDQPTNPVHNPIYVEGFTTFQIPSPWVGNDTWASQLFFAHEHSHTKRTIIRAEGGPDVGDRTHGENPYASQPVGADPDQTDYFADLLIELKPHWELLGTRTGKESMIVVHRKSNPDEKWLLDGSRRRGYSSLLGFQRDTVGQQVVDLALDDAEFDKIPASEAFIED